MNPRYEIYNAALNTLLILLMGFVLGGVFSAELPDNWVDQYDSLIGALATILAGALAYSSVLKKIEHEDKNREKTESNALHTLLQLALPIYAYSIELNDLRRDGQTGRWMEREEKKEEHFQLPDIFYDNVYISQFDHMKTFQIIAFRDAVEKFRKFKMDNHNYEAYYALLNDIYFRFNALFNMDTTGSLDDLYDQRKALLQEQQELQNNQ